MRSANKIEWQETVFVIEPQIRADSVHIWPFDPSFPVAAPFLVFGERQSTRMNRHDYFEVVYVVAGESDWEIGNRRILAKEADLLVIGSSVYHRMNRSGRSHPKIATLFFMPELICATDKDGEEAEFLMPFDLQDANFPYLIPAKTGIPAQVFQLIKRIHEALPANTSRARLSVRTYIKMICIELVNHYAEYFDAQNSASRNGRDPQRLRPLFDHLEHHFDLPITVHEAAKILSMSKPHFMRFFKQITGQSFISYLNHFRIAKAQAMLSSAAKSISEISYEVGFCDQSYFGAVFRRIAKMTPLAYRRQFVRHNGDGLLKAATDSPQGPGGLPENGRRHAIPFRGAAGLQSGTAAIKGGDTRTILCDELH